MKAPLILITAITVIGFFYVVLPIVTDAYRRFRYRKVVTCPDTRGLAEVTLDARRAVFTALLRRPELRVKSCTLWPKKQGCTQACVGENWPAG